MDPTHDSNALPGSTSQPGLFDQIEQNPDARNEVQPRLSADPKIPSPPESLDVSDAGAIGSPGRPVLVQPDECSPEPLWARRLKLVIYVLFCIELGMLLAMLPWTRIWTENSLLLPHPALRQFAQQDFVRGAVTGLGLVDIWLGIREAVNYRENR